MSIISNHTSGVSFKISSGRNISTNVSLNRQVQKIDEIICSWRNISSGTAFCHSFKISSSRRWLVTLRTIFCWHNCFNCCFICWKFISPTAISSIALSSILSALPSPVPVASSICTWRGYWVQRSTEALPATATHSYQPRGVRQADNRSSWGIQLTPSTVENTSFCCRQRHLLAEVFVTDDAIYCWNHKISPPTFIKWPAQLDEISSTWRNFVKKSCTWRKKAYLTKF